MYEEVCRGKVDEGAVKKPGFFFFFPFDFAYVSGEFFRFWL